MSEDDPGGSSDNQSLWLDPANFPAASRGVVLAYDDIAEIPSQMICITPGTVDVFGNAEIRAACASFHDAWKSEIQVLNSALQKLVGLLPAVVEKYEDTDIEAGLSISGAPPFDSPPIGFPPFDFPPVVSPPVVSPPVVSPPVDSPPVDSPPVDSLTTSNPPDHEGRSTDGNRAKE
ncbi:hypothetical protein [Nocardia sp. NBC_00403]|uniref:hypothetical protein n=1 Tax=Nocardia sp. NBC_00403 TaxID=2975990 RepID=UPI002E21CD87